MIDKLKEFREWQRPMRLRTVFYAVTLLFVGFRVSRLEIPGYLYWVAAIILVGGAATQGYNGWVDRYHDKKKGKTFVLENSKKFFVLLWSLWAVSLLLVAAVFVFVGFAYGVVSLVLVILGFLYTVVVRMPFIPGAYVAVVSTGPLVYALVSHPTWQTGLLLIATALFILGRETLKDLDDMEIDEGYKWTLPVRIRARKSKIVVGILYSLAAVIMLAITINALQLAPMTLIIVALTLTVVAVVMLFANKHHKVPKGLADVSMVIVMLTLLVFVQQ